MKKILFNALVIAALTSPSIMCAAQQAPATASATAPADDAMRVQVVKGRQHAWATHPYVLAPQEFAAYAQPYLLETGMVLLFEQRARHYFVQVPREAKVEIYPQAAGVFSSDNGTLFVFRADGDTVAVSHLERLPFAGNALIAPDRVVAALR